MTAPQILSCEGTDFVGSIVAVDIQNPPSLDLAMDLVDWKPIDSGSGCSAFHVRDLATGIPYEARLLPWVKNDRAKNRLHEQIRLSELVAGSGVRKAISLRLNETPPKLIMEPARSLSSQIGIKSSEDRISIVARIIKSIERSMLVGLLHGALTLDSFVWTSDAELRVDYFSRFYSTETYELQPTPQSDAIAAVLLAQNILYPVLTDERFLDRIGGQQRGQFRRLMNASPGSNQGLDLLDQWSQFLNTFVAPKDEASGTGSSKPESSPQSLPTSDITGEVAIAPVQLAESPAANDTTSEVVITPVASGASVKSRFEVGEKLGRYRLEEVIGEGGMGVVYRATDLTNQMAVAVKVLRPSGGDIAHAVRRFRKEARLLASLNNPYITRLYESGVEQGTHYLALEYIDGFDLKHWIKTQKAFDEELALHLTADIARALTDAHDSEIVHRDIKPENVLLQLAKSGNECNRLECGEFQLKLTDFGIARAMHQTASLEVTRAGTMLGTPTFMAPEQFKSSEGVSPAADVYSIGITLFTLLAGEPPFQSNDPMILASMHCFESAPDIRKRNRTVSESTARLLGRMLAKSPTDRPADAAQLVHEIELILRGQVSEFECHPRLPDCRDRKPWERVFQWDLKSSASELWPHVSNTDRLNRAAGLQAVEYRTVKDPEHGLRKYGSFRIGGLRIEWEEHPFEWIEGRRMTVLREFECGPFQWFLNTVELSPLPEGGTRLTHTIKIATRNSVGKVIALIEAGWKSGRNLDRIYRRIDHSLRHEDANPLFDPFESSKPIPRASQRRIEQRVEEILKHGVDIQTTSMLVEYIRDASPQDLAQIRPIDLADKLNLPSEEVVDACLVAAHCGLLQLRWDILCPTCRAPASATEILSAIDRHTYCEACDAEFRSDIGSAIELVFNSNPEIRKADAGQYCIGGPKHSPHVVTQLRLQSQERLECSVPLTEGEYLLRGSQVGTSKSIRVQARSAASSLDVKISQLRNSNPMPIVRAGNVTLVISNDQDQSDVVRLERTINRDDVVTAAVATSSPRFRKLFPDQVLRREGSITADELTLMAARIGTSEAIYESSGDAEAYSIIQQTLAVIEECVAANEGATIKSLGETVMASFQDPLHAIRAALAIEMQISNTKDLLLVRMAQAIHRGTILVTTQNGRLDYFGTTARQVITLSERFTSGISLTDNVFVDPEVLSFINSVDRTVEHETVQLPGAKSRPIQRLVRNQ